MKLASFVIKSSNVRTFGGVSDAGYVDLHAASGGADVGLQVMADLYGVVREKLAQRSKELEDFGVHFLLLHAGGDEMTAHPDRDPLTGLPDVVGAVSIPVGAVIFSLEQAKEAVRQGASFVVQGEPLVSAPDGFERLSELVETIRSV